MAVFDGGWREVGVSLGRDSALVETTLAPDPTWQWLPTVAPHGARLPIQEAASTWVADTCGRLARGTVLSFDYCTKDTTELIGRAWREWLRTDRGQNRGEHYLRNPGGQDITAQVCVDQLPTPTSVELQADFLRRGGIEAFVDEGRREWSAAAARPNVAALTMRSRAREAEALLDLSGLGGFSAIAWECQAEDAES
jgi:SAM-dependent MidA family methyltransferase